MTKLHEQALHVQVVAALAEADRLGLADVGIALDTARVRLEQRGFVEPSHALPMSEPPHVLE